MASIQFYADAKDFRTVHRYLNEHPEIAFIVPDGPRRWCAVREVPKLKGMGMGLQGPAICLWHIPGGPLPLLRPADGQKQTPIKDPWSGWKELYPSGDGAPYFGDPPNVINLYRRLRASEVKGGIGMSSFGWVGRPARKPTEAFWKSLRDWVKDQAVLIPRKGRVDGTPREIWAFPSAVAAFKSGRKRDYNPW